MLKQIRRLTAVSICNIFRINEARYSKEGKKKRQLLSLLLMYLLIAGMMVFYVIGLSYSYIYIGMAELVPLTITAVVSLVILFFSMFKTGNIIFQMETYEMLVSLPVTPSAIIISRFLTMYLGNLLLSALVLLPGMGMYAIHLKPGVSFYIMVLAGLFLLPLLPMTIAMAMGAVIMAVSSRMKHKNLITVLLSLILTMGILFFSMRLSFQAEDLTLEMFSDLSAMMSGQMNQIYPPAVWFAKAVMEGSWMPFLLYAGGSLLVFFLFVFLTQKYFMAVCTALRGERARGNYKMEELKASSQLAALYKKELKRYFSSSLYVLNTMIGYIMMVLAAGGLAITGVGNIEDMIQMPGIAAKALPLLFAALVTMTSTTSASISIEGKHWWIAVSLPVKAKTIFDSKMLVNLTIAVPYYLLTEILLAIGVPMTLLQRLFVILIPAAYICFAAVSGITINAKMPVFDWKTETEVVKQGGAVIITMLVSFISVGIPAVCMIMLPNENVVLLVTLLAVSGITAFLYGRNNRIDLNLLK